MILHPILVYGRGEEIMVGRGGKDARKGHKFPYLRKLRGRKKEERKRRRICRHAFSPLVTNDPGWTSEEEGRRRKNA